jgi:hypothetical protein
MGTTPPYRRIRTLEEQASALMQSADGVCCAAFHYAEVLARLTLCWQSQCFGSASTQHQEENAPVHCQ